MRKPIFKTFTGYLLFSALFLSLRFRALDHILVWDEAWNILSLRSFLSGSRENPLYWYYFFHPPLYMFFAEYLFPFTRNFAFRMATLSLFFSYITFSVVYVFARALGGRLFSWASCFFLSVLPVSLGYDTWIKRDSLATCLGYAALLSIYKRKYIPAAFLLGFSLLSKESALFFILAGYVIIILSKEPRKIKILSVSSAVIIVLNAWWYLHLSTFSGNLFSYYLSQNTSAGIIMSSGVLYYFKKLLLDCGSVNLVFFAAGFLYSTYLLLIKKQQKWLYPLIVFACVYFPLSIIITSKAPWQTVSAVPAIAMLCAAGALFFLRMSGKGKLLKSLVFLLLFLSLLSGINFSYEDFHCSSYPTGWPGAKASRNIAVYLNENMDPDDKLLISNFAYWNEDICPVFMYYWKGQDLIVLREKDIDNTAFIEESINKFGISWLVVPFSPVNDAKRQDAVREISGKLKKDPLRLGWAYIWDLR